MNTTIKKILALGAIAVFAGTTAAHALTLADYPKPFVDAGVFGGKIVIGEKANVIDVLGATDIAASLQRDAATAASSSGTVVVSSSGTTQDVLVGTALNDALAFGVTLDHTDAKFLADSSVTFDNGDTSKDYDYKDQILMPTDSHSEAENLTVRTGLDAAYQDEDWKDRVFIPVKARAIGYKYDFDSSLLQNVMIANASEDNPFTINFLGKDLKITAATTDTMTVQVGNEYFMGVNDIVTVDGKKITLVNVASSGDVVVVDVDGVRETVSSSGTVNGIRIKVLNTFTSDTMTERSATLVIGDTTTKTYTNGDAFIGEDEDNPAWTWKLASLETATPTIEVEWALNLDTQTETDNAAYKHPLYEGESIKFPNNFAEVRFDSMNQNEYATYELKDDIRDLYELSTNTTALYVSASVLRLSVAGLSNTGLLTSTTKSDTVWLYPVSNYSINVYAKDANNNKAVYVTQVAGTYTGATLTTLDYGKNTVTLTFVNGTAGAAGLITGANLTFDFTSTATGHVDDEVVRVAIETSAANKFTYIGLDDLDTDTGLQYNVTSIAGWEEDTRTLSGVKIYDPDSTFQKTSGAFKFDLPKDVNDYRANIVIEGMGSVTPSTATTGAVSLNPIAVGLAIMDKDATLGSKPYIVVGGPCGNTVAAALMGNPADCTAGFAEGKAKIKLFADKNALLVAGFSGLDTQGASRVLANYKDYASKFTGTELEVVTANLNSLSVSNVQ